MKKNVIGKVILKIIVSYLINSFVIGAFVALGTYRFQLDMFDSLLICGAAMLIYSLLTMNQFQRSLPAVSPMNPSSSGIGDAAAHAALLNTLVADNERDIPNRDRADYTPAAKFTWHYYLIYRSKYETISYSILLIILGLIKYYKYF